MSKCDLEQKALGSRQAHTYENMEILGQPEEWVFILKMLFRGKLTHFVHIYWF